MILKISILFGVLAIVGVGFGLAALVSLNNQRYARYQERCNIPGYEVVKLESKGFWCMKGFELE